MSDRDNLQTNTQLLMETTMRTIKQTIMAIAAVIFLASPAWAADTSNSAVAVQGYDVVGYFTEGKPVKGNGDHVVLHDGLNYLFASDTSKKTFEGNPEKYVPQFGGWCAFGVGVNKKFVGDPEVWKIVDGKLYLNLSKKVAELWVKDIPGNIVKANSNWPNIKDENPTTLNAK